MFPSSKGRPTTPWWPALARHAGHLIPSRTSPPRTSARTGFCPIAYARQNTSPACSYTAPVLVLNHSERLVLELDQRAAIRLAQPVLYVRNHGVRHEQRPGDLQQSWPLDRLHLPPEMAAVFAQIAEPSPPRPCFELHRNRSAIGR